MNRIRSAAEMGRPRQASIHPRPVRSHCYSSGSLTGAERKILAGRPVRHERRWPTISLSSLPNAAAAGQPRSGNRRRYLQKRTVTCLIMTRQYVSLVYFSAPAERLRQDQRKPRPLPSWPPPSAPSARGLAFSNISSGMTWGDLFLYVPMINGVDLNSQRSTHPCKCNISRCALRISFVFK